MSEITVPELGESIVEATILQWLKNPGDPVNAGEALAELETDKVNVEVIANDSGVLESIRKQAGETVQVGEVIGVLRAGNAAAPAPTTPAAPAAGPVTTAPAAVPPAAPASAPPAVAPAPAAPAAAAPAAGTPAAAPAPAAQTATVAPLPLRPTPAMRRQAREHGWAGSPSGVIPGPGAASAAAAAVSPAPASRPAAAPATVPPAPTTATPLANGRPDEERVRMSRRRLTIARRLVEVQQTAAMLTTFNEVDMTAVMDIRKRRKDNFKEAHGVGLGFMSFFTKAVVGALKQFPRLNAEISGDDMILKYHYDIGIAVATEGGLVVPVVRDADRLTFAEIEREIDRLAKKARNNELSLEDLRGGTFTITNGGVFGSLFSTPILNGPQVGILGMHGIQQRPVAIDGKVEIRPMMYLALSYDHRIVDGAEAVRFLVKIKQMIEDPEQLLLEG
ncbi:MAG: 2-oxoglutarate dehydrogenase complex dihydrolipoyllysine-residue succinyltransferase [Alicyclobacillus sp.]|nr:2-oxoglutarate dehydrogenase complex dihydrolipoyllysine-residue succinyltransferase [Alicyclobacillus sp.]